MNVEGLPVVISGGASGLGAATARRLASGGARVAIFDTNANEGEAIAQEIGGLFCRVDITDETMVEAALDTAQRAHGVGRALVNCAGVALGMPAVGPNFAPHPADVFRRILEVNLVGTFVVLSRFAARLQQVEPIGEERGVIVNTASTAAFDGMGGRPAYAASKGGVVSMTIPLAREFAPTLIRVMTIAPGLFWTPMLEELAPDLQAALAKKAPHPSRFGTPEEFAALAENIVANAMLNGATLRLDAALRMTPG